MLDLQPDAAILDIQDRQIVLPDLDRFADRKFDLLLLHEEPSNVAVVRF